MTKKKVVNPVLIYKEKKEAFDEEDLGIDTTNLFDVMRFSSSGSLRGSPTGHGPDSDDFNLSSP